MKKFMVADLVKDAFGLSQSERDYLEANYDQSEWQDVMATAEALDMGIEDVSDDDVEEFLSTGGADEIDTSMGKAIFKWDKATATYILFIIFDNNISMYKGLSRDQVIQMKNADSFGSLYNDTLRENESYELCGCNPNPCSQEELDRIPSKFRSYL